MPKFRRNHGSQGNKRGKTNFMRRSIVLIIIACILIFLISRYIKEDLPQLFTKEEPYVYNIELEGTDFIKPENRFYLPSSTTGQIIHHKYYSLSYNEDYEVAEWVSYILTKESLRIPNVERAKRFKKDLKIKTRSAIYYDYSGSGYTRGHLAPAGDMAFNEEAMQESFFMSNISPQKKEFNNGIWKELEQNIRNWAWNNNKLFVVTGPVLNNSINEYIGKNKVAVPKYFYKVIIDIDDPERKAIGWVIPNEVSIRHLSDYAKTVDQVEELIGVDFFKDLLTDDEEEKLESNINVNKWKVSEKMFKKRLEIWNKEE